LQGWETDENDGTGNDGVDTVMMVYGYCLCYGVDHIDDKKL
jgi:hypothetical protein